MHNKYATFVLPVLAGLAIVGAGFSTWVFGENASDASAQATGSITITDVDDSFAASVQLGTKTDETTFEGSDTLTFSLTLDQGSSASDVNDGIILDGLTSFDIKWLAAKTDEEGNGFMEIYNGYYVTLTYDIEKVYGGNTATYLAWNSSKLTDSVKFAVNDMKSEEAGDYYLWDANIANDWIYASKPTSFSQYDEMVSSLMGPENTVGLKVTVSAALSAN